MKYNLGYFIIFLTTVYGTSLAQVKYVNEFLNIGVGAEAIAKGGTHLTNIHDATAAYWNPAALVSLKNNLEFSYMHSEYFAGIAKYDFGNFAFKINDSSAFAISYLRFGVDDIPNTLELVDANGNFNFDRITQFSTTDNAWYFSYARKLTIPGLSVGGNAKLIYRKVGPFANATGFGLDFSAAYNMEKWKFAAVLRDGVGTFNAWRFNTELLEETFARTGNELPENSIETAVPILMLGTGYAYNFNEDFKFYPEVNVDVTFDGKRNVLLKSNFASADVRIGAQGSYQDIIFVRLGVKNIQEEQFVTGDPRWTFQPNIGVGMQFKKVAFDYALSDLGDQSEALYTHILSLRIGFNKQ